MHALPCRPVLLPLAYGHAAQFLRRHARMFDNKVAGEQSHMWNRAMGPVHVKLKVMHGLTNLALQLAQVLGNTLHCQHVVTV